ncbi:MAG: hypothetical protein ABSF53_07655 [Terracidiphilus sp.]
MAQLSNLSPHTKDASIYLYPTLDEAKILLEARSPFSFEGSLTMDGRQVTQYRSSEIWLNYGSKITFYEMFCYTQCSGRLVDLQIKNEPMGPVSEPTKGSAWFVTNGCYLLRFLATPSAEELRNRTNPIERAPYRFSLSNGGVAEMARITAHQSRKREKETKKTAYAIQVGSLNDVSNAERDVSGLLILASLASRERSDFSYWSVREPGGTNTQNWRFGFGRLPKRSRAEEPLIRMEGCCSGFLVSALKIYLAAPDSSSVDSAVYALLATELPVETRIVRLYTALQAVLIYALAVPDSTSKTVKELFEEFKKQYAIDISDLWPLIDGPGKPSLNRIRNTLVHGKAFTARSDFKSLSIAAENLQWLLERVLLATLGWDVERSDVSSKSLRRYTAHQWGSEFKNLKI